MRLEHDEWATNSGVDRTKRIDKKIDKYFECVDNKFFCKLILVKNDTLIGFISIFPYDCDGESCLTPWYATMFIKKEYRNMGYSKILNEAIIIEAKKRGIKELFLKTKLDNYYERFGAMFVKKIKTGEKILKFDIK